MKLEISKNKRHNFLWNACVQGSELNLSDESDGIVELSNTKYEKKIGKNYFPKNNLKVIDIS